MQLIEVFTEYVRNKKSLRDYVEYRKTTDERGEFNDAKLLRAQEHLERLEKENSEVYNKMYATLEEYFKQDRGYTVEYPINFVKTVLKMYDTNVSVEKVYEDYEKGLKHKERDA